MQAPDTLPTVQLAPRINLERLTLDRNASSPNAGKSEERLTWTAAPIRSCIILHKMHPWRSMGVHLRTNWPFTPSHLALVHIQPWLECSINCQTKLGLARSCLQMQSSQIKSRLGCFHVYSAAELRSVCLPRLCRTTHNIEKFLNGDRALGL
jgi:hypothetical protein